MSKRKILILAMALCMVAILAVGGTLAYFTSEDSANNVFTMGNVKIDLIEAFDPETAILVPGVDIEKNVTVKNTGDLPAYVRVHIAIPANMDDGNPSFAAVNNFLHFNFTNESVADGQWSWAKTAADKNYVPGAWNYYETKIDGVDYAVYVVTYETALAAGDTTAHAAMTKVYLEATVDAVEDKDGTITYTDTKGNKVTLAKDAEIEIKVVAEGTQSATFENAHQALDTAFGVPGTYFIEWPN